MLVLTRKEGERIQIGDDIVIEVVRINHSQVRLGILAPQEVAIVRTELLRQKPTSRIADERGG